MNQDIERTEELLKHVNKKGSKKKLIIVVAILAVLAIGGGVFAGLTIHNSSQITEKLNKANALLKEGDYKAALTAYEDVIEIDKNNAAAYEGAGDSNRGLGKPKEALANYEKSIEKDKKRKSPYPKAIQTATELGDDKKAEKLVKDMNKNVEGAENVTVGQMTMGCTPANMQASGIICESTEGLFIANKPNKGDISLVDNDGKEKKVFTYGDLGDNQYLGYLNYWDGWIYYSVVEDVNDLDGNFTTASVRRIKLDGSSDMKIEGLDLFRPENVAIIRGKIVCEYSQNPDTTELFNCDLTGKNKESIATNINSFTSDGKDIYYIQNKMIEGGSEIIKSDIHGNHKDVFSKEKIYQIIGNDNKKLYGIGDVTDMDAYLFGVDFHTRETSIYEEHAMNSTYNVNNGKFIYSSNQSMLMYEIEGNENNSNHLNITTFDIDKEKSKDIEQEFKLEEVFKNMNYEEGADAIICNMQNIDEKIYYQLNRYEHIEGGIGGNASPIFGCLDMDTGENELYGY